MKVSRFLHQTTHYIAKKSVNGIYPMQWMSNLNLFRCLANELGINGTSFAVSVKSILIFYSLWRFIVLPTMWTLLSCLGIMFLCMCYGVIFKVGLSSHLHVSHFFFCSYRYKIHKSSDPANILVKLTMYHFKRIIIIYLIR